MEEIKELIQSKSVLQQQNQNAITDLQYQRKLTGVVEQQKTSAQGDQAKLTNQITELKKTNNIQIEVIHKQEQAISQHKSEFDILQKKLVFSESELEKYKLKMMEGEKVVKAAKSNETLLISQISELKAQLQNHKEIVTDLNKDSQDFRDAKLLLLEKSQKVEALMSKTIEMEKSQIEMQNEINQSKTQLASLQKRMDTSNQHIQELTNQISQDKEHYEHLIDQANEKNNLEIDRLKAEQDEILKKSKLESDHIVEEKTIQMNNMKLRFEQQIAESGVTYRNLSKTTQLQVQKLQEKNELDEQKSKDAIAQLQQSVQQETDELNHKIERLTLDIEKSNKLLVDFKVDIQKILEIAKKLKLRIFETEIKKLNPVHGGLLDFHQLLKLSDCMTGKLLIFSNDRTYYPRLQKESCIQ
jgi:hypothetical protein